MEEVVRFGQYLKKSEEDTAEAIDIYKTLGDDENIGRTKLVKMDIDTGDSPPVCSRPYTLPSKHYKWVQREIESLE